MLRSDKVDFKQKLVRRGGEDHFILVSGIIHQEDLTVVNLTIGAQSFIKETLLDIKA
jgi:hypothetical protein